MAEIDLQLAVGMGHVERMAADRLTKRADVYREEGRRGRGRGRWEDCVKRDVRKAGVEDRYWRAKANDRREWRKIVRNAIDKP